MVMIQGISYYVPLQKECRQLLSKSSGSGVNWTWTNTIEYGLVTMTISRSLPDPKLMIIIQLLSPDTETVTHSKILII